MAHTYGAVHSTKMRFDLISSADNLKNLLRFSYNIWANTLFQVQIKLQNQFIRFKAGQIIKAYWEQNL